VVENPEWTTVYVAVPLRAHTTRLTTAGEMVDDAIIILMIVLHICDWKSGGAVG
jgi:hypothetical protein